MITEKSARVLRGTFHWYEQGDHRNSAVLLHGRLESGICWKSFASLLECPRKLYLPDARNHGKTRLHEQQLRIETLIDDLTVFFDILGLKNAVFIGHSMGAATAAHFAVKYPECVESLILIDPPWRDDGDYIDSDMRSIEKMRKTIRNYHRLSADSLRSYIHYNFPRWSLDDCHAVAQAWKEVAEDVAESFHSPVSYRSWEEQYVSQQYPVLLCTGNSSRGAIVTDTLVKRIVQTFPDIEHVHFADAGHSIMRDEPNRLASVIDTFLQRNE